MNHHLYIFPVLGLLLQAALLWRLLKTPLRSQYPYLVAFVSYSLMRDLALFPIAWYRAAWFPWAYWRAETVALFLGFAVNWEFFRHVFPHDSVLHEIATKALVLAGLCLLPTVILLVGSQASSSRYAYSYVSPVFVQYVTLVQALLLIGPAAVAWYYRLSLGRNVRGLGLGFGVYLSVHSINVANAQMFRGFFRWWQLLSPITFLGMTAIWLWSFWNFVPSPELPQTRFSRIP